MAQPGRALGSGPRGRRFKSSRPDQITFKACRNAGFFVERYAVLSLVKHSVSLADARVGTECSALQIRLASRIVRNSSPPSLATRSIPALFKAKCYPRRYSASWSDTDSRRRRLIRSGSATMLPACVDSFEMALIRRSRTCSSPPPVRFLQRPKAPHARGARRKHSCIDGWRPCRTLVDDFR